MPFLRIDPALRREDLVERRVGCPPPDQIGKIGLDWAADYRAREFIENHAIQALLALLGFLAQRSIQLRGDTANGVMLHPSACMLGHAFMLSRSGCTGVRVAPPPATAAAFSWQHTN